MIPISCTHCGVLSRVDEAWIGQWVECPQCRQATLAAAMPAPPAPPPVAPPLAVAERRREMAKPRATPRRLTRDERRSIRRRRHLAFGLGGIIVLTAAVYLLLACRQ
jgi:hypothetical protein